MSLYSDASLVMIPSGYKDAKVYSAKPVDGSGDLDFSRGSDIEATRVNANGYIEKAQVNLLLQSNSFDTTWLNILTTSTSGQTGYDGSSNAWLLSKSAPAAYIEEGGLSGSGIYTLSVYAKAGTLNWLRFVIAHSGSNPACYYDLANGVVGTPKDNVDATITSVGGGWYRCSLTGDLSSLAAVRIYPADADEDTTGTSGNIYIQDAQLNYGLVAQTYQETTTAAVVSGITDNMPRLNYDPANPTCPSLLLEPSRNNLIAHSEYIGSYTFTNVSNTQNSATSPEGVVNSCQVSNTSTGAAYLFPSNSVSITSGTNYTASAFVKADGGSYVQISFSSPAFGGTQYQNFDVTTGVLGSGSGMSDKKIEDYGNGWYRISATAVATATTSVTGGFLLAIVPSATATRIQANTAAGLQFQTYGFQLEAGSYVSSMIPTYGSSATRTADACSKTGISSLIGQTEGTVFVEGEAVTIDTSSNSPIYITVSNGNQTDICYIQQTLDGPIRVDYFAGGVRQARITSTTTYPLGTKIKAAFGYKSGDFVFYINGVLIGTETTGTSTAPLSKITIGAFETANFTGSAISQALLFKTRLSNNDLATLTSL